MLAEERWSRNCGSGAVGTSGHQNEYRSGVLIRNHVEDRFGDDLTASGTHILGTGQPFVTATSEQQRQFNDTGRTGADLAVLSHRHDKELGKEGPGADLLTRHGDFWQPRTACHATMNQLTYGPNRAHGEPRVQTYVWEHSNTHNAAVPLTTTTLGATAAKQQQWQQQVDANPYTCTSRSTQLASALEAPAQGRTGTQRRMNNTGELGSVGRKTTGDFGDECDKTYRRTGLRDKHYPGNLA